MTKLAVFWLVDSRGRTIAYWIATMLLAAENVLGGIWDVARIPFVRTDVVELGSLSTY